MNYAASRRMLAAFEEEGVRYLVFGGAAMNLHGLPRFTEDLDVFVEPTRENVEAVKRALRKVYDDPSIEETLRDEYQLEYVELDGNIGLISGGAGLTMTAMDCITIAGGLPACFMDCSANVSPTGYEMALRTLNSRRDVDCILMNIFGGITRMDRVGEYILEALKRIGGMNKPLVIRLEGTDAEKGREFIRKAGLSLCETFEEAVQKAVELGGKRQ